MPLNGKKLSPLTVGTYVAITDQGYRPALYDPDTRYLWYWPNIGFATGLEAAEFSIKALMNARYDEETGANVSAAEFDETAARWNIYPIYPN